MNFSAIDPSDFIVPGLIFAALLAVFALTNAWQKKLRARYGKVVESFFRHLHTPIEVLLVLTALYAVIESLQYRWAENAIFARAYSIAAIVTLGWLGVRLVQLLAFLALRRPGAGGKVPPHPSLISQVGVAQRLAIGLIVVLTVATLLATIEPVRVLGFILLAMVGIAATIVGVASLPTLRTIVTGLQVTIARPIAIGDTVLIDGAPGQVEAIHLTHVIVVTDNAERLVVPVGTFVERPFRRFRSAPAQPQPRDR